MKDFLHHFLFPRESNSHRPKALHHHTLLLTILFLLGSLFFATTVQKQYPSVLGISADISVSDLLAQTNQKRQENGLPALTLNQNLSQAAAGKAQDMFAKDYWAHIAPDGTTPWVFIKNSGYEYLYAGENLARGFTTAPEVVNAWMASPTHRENLLSPNYKEIGFAVKTGTLTGSETILVVQMFGTKYLAKDEDASPPAVAAAPIESAPVSQVTIMPTSGQVLPSKVPDVSSPIEAQPTSAEPLKKSDIAPQAELAVAAIQSKPLVDSKSVKWNLSIFVIVFFIVILVLDAVIVERKKIIRVASHNLDHILFLIIILLAVIIIGKGLIL
jgi:uncharacterized protein YkwD